MATKPKKEPIFGEGALPFLAQLVGLGAACAIILAVAMIGIRSQRAVSEMLFGEPNHAPHLEPGESTVINGVTIKRIN
jgi:hypothetical protein